MERVIRWSRRGAGGLLAVTVGGVALAGCHRPSIVEGIVWFDDDFDGVRDVGEQPAAGIRVRVDCHYTDPDASSDGVCDTAVTDGDGRYRLFVRVDPSGETEGTVRFQAPTGLRAVEPPGVEWQFSFGHREQRDVTGIEAALVDVDEGALGDLVWHDDGDGIQEPGEPGIEGIAVELHVGFDQVVATAVTDADGRYRFDDVAAGRYDVRFGPLPPGFRFATDRRGLGTEDSDANPYSGLASVVVEGGQQDLDVDAGVVAALRGELGTIGDRVWSDEDADGIQDGGEPGAAGVEVLLVGARTGQLAFTVTDLDGRYSFQVSRALAPDHPYRVVFGAPPGRSLSPPDAGGNDALDSDPDPATSATADFTLGPDEVNTSVDAGIRGFGPLPATIGDVVWEDADGDGIQDAGEPGVAGVTVSLIDAGDVVVGTRVTDAGGRYRFSGLAAGDHRIRFEVPGGFALTAADQGADDALDSDADPATGQTPVVSLVAGAEDLSVDAGLRALPTGGATIGDRVWRELDHDGVQEPGEPGVPNAAVTLLDQQGAVVASAATEDGGLYGFANVAPGTYTLRFGFPPGLLPTTANAGTDDAVDSDINGGGVTAPITVADGQTDFTIDAGFAPPA